MFLLLFFFLFFLIERHITVQSQPSYISNRVGGENRKEKEKKIYSPSWTV